MKPCTLVNSCQLRPAQRHVFGPELDWWMLGHGIDVSWAWQEEDSSSDSEGPVAPVRRVHHGNNSSRRAIEEDEDEDGDIEVDVEQAVPRQVCLPEVRATCCTSAQAFLELHGGVLMQRPLCKDFQQ